MSARIPTQVKIAPRGKAFAVLRCDHVAGGRIVPLKMPGRWLTRADAEKAAASVDERLSPRVFLVDEIRVTEDRS
ncbi:hypothetical protein [Piscinibacter defluvii]|uniref:hypothetical protein n=1 Tax=Piscinibacter defluvii TaxID=1796922 RepID=UPI000FDE9D3C|nr:hypothetical protein [Piscinibacter defluvii]